LKSLFPHKEGIDNNSLRKAYQDVLELTRCVEFLNSTLPSNTKQILLAYRRGCYSPRVRKQALRLVLLQIYSGQNRDLLKYLSEWPTIEISIFLRELMMLIPPTMSG